MENKTEIEYTIVIYSPHHDDTEHIYDSYLDLWDINELDDDHDGSWKTYEEALYIFNKIIPKMKNTIYTKLNILKEEFEPNTTTTTNENNENSDCPLISCDIVKTFTRDVGPSYKVKCFICEEEKEWYSNVEWMCHKFLLGWGENQKTCEGAKENKCTCNNCKWICEDCSYDNETEIEKQKLYELLFSD